MIVRLCELILIPEISFLGNNNTDLTSRIIN